MSNFIDIIPFETLKEDPKHYAELVSQENKYLERLILFCIKHDIETNSCSAAHCNGAQSFLVFNLSHLQPNHINTIINTVYDINNTSIKVNRLYDEKILRLWIITRYLSVRDEMFDAVYKTLSNNQNTNDINDDIKNMIKIVQNFNQNKFNFEITSKNICNQRYYEVIGDYIFHDSRRDMAVVRRSVDANGLVGLGEALNKEAEDYSKMLKQEAQKKLQKQQN